MIERCATYSEIYLFTDDAKLFKHILSESGQEMIQEGVDELCKWTIVWLLNLNNVRLSHLAEMLINPYVLGLIKRNFKYLTTESFTLLYMNMVRSQLLQLSRPYGPRIEKAILKLLKRCKIKPQRFCPNSKI